MASDICMKIRQFFILFYLIFWACNPKEDPNPIPNPPIEEDQSLVSFEGIDLLNGQYSGKQRFAETWGLEIKNLENQASQIITLTPNESPISSPISLPFGKYSYHYRSAEIPEFSEPLPVDILGEFELKNSTETIRLQVSGLSEQLKVSANFDLATPRVIAPFEKNLFSYEGSFQAYLNSEELLKIKVPLPGSIDHLIQFHKPESSENYSIEYPVSVPGLYERKIKLNTDGFPWSLIPTPLNTLDEELDEISGLAFYQNRLFAINDGDNPNQIIELNPLTGAILRKITVENATNVDWESLAQSDQHLFIGDFGNNLGARKDLIIYRVNWEDVLNEETVAAERITFNYPNQQDFSPRENHRFDCEAFIFADNQLHIFTKNRGRDDSDYHRIPAIPGDYATELIETLPTDGLVTGASIHAQTGKIIFIGYKIPLEGFVWLVDGFEENGLTKDIKRIQIEVFPMGLTEGIVFREDGNAWYSSERVTLAGIYDISARLSILGVENLY